MVNHEEALAAVSVTLNWQLVYVALESELKTIVWVQDIAVVVALEHDPLYVIVPVSSDVKL